MRIIKPSARVMKHDCTPYEFIEKVGRTCYKSEDKITKGSANKFVKGLIDRNHWAMLEHETLYLVVSDAFMEDFMCDMNKENERLKYFNITVEKGNNVLSGSFRSFHDLFEKGYKYRTLDFIEAGMKFIYPTVFGEQINYEELYEEETVFLLDGQEFIDKFKDRPDILFHHLTHTFLFVCDRGVSHEFVRHRPASFAQESTRYCCYVKEKFGAEISVIEPCFWKGENSAYPYEVWKEQCESAEKSYFRLVDMGATPQEARSVLPSSLKTEIIITATEEEWQHIVNLRYLGTTGAPHPQIREVMGFAIEDIINETKGRVNLLYRGAK